MKLRSFILGLCLSSMVCAYELPKCISETCLIVDDIEYGFDFEENLNSHDSLMDIDLSGACFRGDKKEVFDIIQALAYNTNVYYTQGGHVLVKRVSQNRMLENSLFIEVLFQTDYDREDLKITETITRCQRN